MKKIIIYVESCGGCPNSIFQTMGSDVYCKVLEKLVMPLYKNTPIECPLEDYSEVKNG
jgi:hypothetical protein